MDNEEDKREGGTNSDVEHPLFGNSREVSVDIEHASAGCNHANMLTFVNDITMSKSNGRREKRKKEWERRTCDSEVSVDVATIVHHQAEADHLQKITWRKSKQILEGGDLLILGGLLMMHKQRGVRYHRRQKSSRLW